MSGLFKTSMPTPFLSAALVQSKLLEGDVLTHLNGSNARLLDFTDILKACRGPDRGGLPRPLVMKFSRSEQRTCREGRYLRDASCACVCACVFPILAALLGEARCRSRVASLPGHGGDTGV